MLEQRNAIILRSHDAGMSAAAPRFGVLILGTDLGEVTYAIIRAQLASIVDELLDVAEQLRDE